MKILITGINGFVGSNLVKDLKANHTLYGLDLKTEAKEGVADINGCNEIIINNENGVIIPPKDSEALFLTMKQFLDEPNEVSRMAKNARPLIKSRYEQRDVWNALLEMYKSLD